MKMVEASLFAAALYCGGDKPIFFLVWGLPEAAFGVGAYGVLNQVFLKVGRHNES
jgi:hypothetical protein